MQQSVRCGDSVVLERNGASTQRIFTVRRCNNVGRRITVIASIRRTPEYPSYHEHEHCWTLTGSVRRTPYGTVTLPGFLPRLRTEYSILSSTEYGVSARPQFPFRSPGCRLIVTPWETRAHLHCSTFLPLLRSGFHSCTEYSVILGGNPQLSRIIIPFRTR